MHFSVTGAAKRYAIARFELRLGEKRLAADVVRGQASARVAVHASVSVTFADELAPSAQAALAR
jgi:hypothetical protein